MGVLKHKRMLAAAAAPADPNTSATVGWAEDRALEKELREAVAAAKFQLHFQPLVAVESGEIVGVEALLRWESGAGRIFPATFLPVLESTGLICELGPWVMAEACRRARPWAEADPAFLLAVNISPRQLEAAFAETVLRVAGETGFPPEQICLDLVRPSSISDPTGAWAELRRLKVAGVRLFVDDFGALGSSIADLRRFAVDAVKIDASFVAGLGRDPDDEAIVAAIVALSAALGVHSIAEGVESEEQLEHLRDLGCDLAQGYHFTAPLPPALIPEVMDRPRLAV